MEVIIFLEPTHYANTTLFNGIIKQTQTLHIQECPPFFALVFFFWGGGWGQSCPSRGSFTLKYESKARIWSLPNVLVRISGNFEELTCPQMRILNNLFLNQNHIIVNNFNNCFPYFKVMLKSYNKRAGEKWPVSYYISINLFLF